MGWTETLATHYTPSGKIDRKAECDAYFLERNPGCYEILKSAMVGSVYYAAVRCVQVCTGEDEAGNKTYRPADDQSVWAAVFRTSTRGPWFGYKDMDETMGPCEDKCPESILSLLDVTDNEWANEWRDRCWKYATRKLSERKSPFSLRNLDVGTKIRFTLDGKEYTVEKMAPAYQFKRNWWKVVGCAKYVKEKVIKEAGSYEILEI